MVNRKAVFHTYPTRADELKGIIAYYYIHYASADVREEFVYYPHYRNAITAYLNSDLSISDNTSRVRPNSKAGLTLLYTRNYSERIKVELTGPFKKLGIAFEPLGLQRFLNKPFNEVAKQLVIHFAEFGKEFEELCIEILNNPSGDPSEKLDAYFTARPTARVNCSIETAVEVLLKNEESMNLEDLASDLGLSMRTLQRKFKENMACTPREYQQLIRFRRAINAYQNATVPTTFTLLAMEANYYDQPAFVNHFKRITGRSPREFFSHLQKLGSEDTYWAFNRLSQKTK